MKRETNKQMNEEKRRGGAVSLSYWEKKRGEKMRVSIIRRLIYLFIYFFFLWFSAFFSSFSFGSSLFIFFSVLTEPSSSEDADTGRFPLPV